MQIRVPFLLAFWWEYWHGLLARWIGPRGWGRSKIWGATSIFPKAQPHFSSQRWFYYPLFAPIMPRKAVGCRDCLRSKIRWGSMGSASPIHRVPFEPDLVPSLATAAFGLMGLRQPPWRPNRWICCGTKPGSEPILLLGSATGNPEVRTQKAENHLLDHL